MEWALLTKLSSFLVLMYNFAGWKVTEPSAALSMLCEFVENVLFQ